MLSDTAHHLGVDPGLVKDGVEAHLQKLLAEQVHVFGSGWTLVQREFRTRSVRWTCSAGTPPGRR